VMELIKILTPDFSFEDERGVITQLCHEGYNQINAVYSKKGALRGRMHYHKDNEESFFIISGSARVIVKNGADEEEYVFSTGDMFMIPRFVRHHFVYLEDTYLIGMYSGCVERGDGTKDIYSDEEEN